MRIEKAYHGWGADFGVEYTMFDAGLNGFVDKSRDNLIGADQFKIQARSQPEWRFVRLIVDSDDADPLPGDPILVNNECVGYVTSACMGYRIDQCVALGYVENRVPEDVEDFEVVVVGVNLEACLSKSAFYDPDHSRCKV